MCANPPFGVKWEAEQDEVTKEHESQGFAGRFGAGLPRINDGSFLFLQHMISKMKKPEDVGTLESKDTGTTSSSGMIGKGRRFDVGKGINGGEKIAGYPSGASPHTSEAWFRADKSNATILGWGNEQAQGKVVMQFVSPPHINMDCYFSGGNVASGTTMPMAQWAHVVHTYRNGESRIHVNGVLDGTNTSRGSPLAIKSPARMYVGGWYNNFNFVGDIDEVRISKVTRSADWVRLQYENQNPLQTLVGPVVQPGTDFSVSEKKLTVLEGKSAVVAADPYALTVHLPEGFRLASAELGGAVVECVNEKEVATVRLTPSATKIVEWRLAFAK